MTQAVILTSWVPVKQYPSSSRLTGLHRKCTFCQFIMRARWEEAMKHEVFPNLMFACMMGGEGFSSCSCQSGLDNPAVYSFGE